MVLREDDAEYYHILEKPAAKTTKPGTSSLRTLLRNQSPSKYTTVMLCAHEWKVSKIIVDWRSKDRNALTVQIDVDGADEADAEEPSSPKSYEPRTQVGSRHSSRPDAGGMLKATRPSTLESSKPQSGSENDRVRSYSLDPRQGTKRGQPVDSEGADFLRGKCCRPCAIDGSRCDYKAQCGNCRLKGVPCVRLVCGSGPMCRGPPCPLLHPGEWDEKDPQWVVVAQKPRLG